MSGPGGEPDRDDLRGGDDRGEESAAALRRRRRLALLGDTVPVASTDETGPGWSEPASSSRDEELRRDVPPHHG